MRRRLHPCRKHRENVSLLAGGALPAAEQKSTRDHLENCSSCREYHEELASLSDEFQQWAKTQPPVEIDPAFHARWMQSIVRPRRPTRTSWAALVSRWSVCLWPSPAAWGGMAAIWIWLIFLQWATPARRADSHALAGSPSGDPVIRFTQRQRELSSLLEILAPPPEPTQSESPRPRSQGRLGSVTI
jgi:hypothetical protein